jgi:hypothetical protein
LKGKIQESNSAVEMRRIGYGSGWWEVVEEKEG